MKLTKNDIKQKRAELVGRQDVSRKDAQRRLRAERGRLPQRHRHRERHPHPQAELEDRRQARRGGGVGSVR